jgi:hypothetical protein
MVGLIDGGIDAGHKIGAEIVTLPERKQAPKGPIRLAMVGGGEGALIGAVHRIASPLDDEYVLVAGTLSSTPEKAMRSSLG